MLALNTGAGGATKKPHAKAVLKYDTTTVNVRGFDKAVLEKYNSNPEFQYNEAKESLSWWGRFWRWFWNWLQNLFTLRVGQGVSILAIIFQIFEILLVLGGIAALIYFILKAAGIEPRNIFRRKSANTSLPYQEYLEDIHAIDFDSEIEKAVSAHNYRLAVRLLYLKCLKKLSESGLIDWRAEKTNNNYINELKDAGQKEVFSRLTRQFEYVWYGDFIIDSPVYRDIDLLFRDFYKRVA